MIKMVQMTEAEADLLVRSTSLIFGGIIIFVYISLLLLPSFDRWIDRSHEASRLNANKRYGVQLTTEDMHVLKKYKEWGESKWIFNMKPILGPRGDNTIDLTVKGELIRNISLTNNHGVWVLKTDGVELPRIS